MQRHAYLILAHTDAPLLSTLVRCLDDSRNDIYVHWDAKSGNVPELKVEQSRLFLLNKRIGVNWAGFSMVKAELLLFKEAYANGPYEYYHLISGADLPIKSQDYIRSECEKMAGTEFIAFADASQQEIDYRTQHYFLFPEEFRTKNIIKRGLRYLYLKYQDVAHKRRSDIIFKKGSQWCSLTHDFVGYLLSQEDNVRKLFSHTFCPDELLIQTVCYNSSFFKNVKKADSEFDGNLRFIKWKDGELLPIEEKDLEEMKQSDKWFARKFSGSDRRLIDKVLELSK